jgi:hypothetical protein
MHCHEGMHLYLVQGSFLSQPKTDRPHDAAPWWEHAHFPLPSELYRVCFAHGTPTALFMARQNMHIIINGTCSYRSGIILSWIVLKFGLRIIDTVALLLHST